MDDAGLAAGLIAARVGQLQLAVAAKMLRMNAETAQSAVKLIDAAQQNVDRLANVATGVGTSVDISA